MRLALSRIVPCESAMCFTCCRHLSGGIPSVPCRWDFQNLGDSLGLSGHCQCFQAGGPMSSDWGLIKASISVIGCQALGRATTTTSTSDRIFSGVPMTAFKQAIERCAPHKTLALGIKVFQFPGATKSISQLYLRRAE